MAEPRVLNGNFLIAVDWNVTTHNEFDGHVTEITLIAPDGSKYEGSTEWAYGTTTTVTVTR